MSTACAKDGHEERSSEAPSRPPGVSHIARSVARTSNCSAADIASTTARTPATVGGGCIGGGAWG